MWNSLSVLLTQLSFKQFSSAKLVGYTIKGVEKSFFETFNEIKFTITLDQATI